MSPLLYLLTPFSFQFTEHLEGRAPPSAQEPSLTWPQHSPLSDGARGQTSCHLQRDKHNHDNLHPPTLISVIDASAWRRWSIPQWSWPNKSLRFASLHTHLRSSFSVQWAPQRGLVTCLPGSCGPGSSVSRWSCLLSLICPLLRVLSQLSFCGQYAFLLLVDQTLAVSYLACADVHRAAFLWQCDHFLIPHLHF